MAQLFESIDHRRSVIDQSLPGNKTSEHNGHADVEQSTDHQGSQDAYGNIALRPMALLRRRRDRIEADVGKENDAATGEHTRPPVGEKRMPMTGMDEPGSD